MHLSIFVPLPHTNLPAEVKEWKAGHTLDSEWNVTSEPAEPEGQSISGMVNQDEVKQIMEMGFSKAVAEKALFMT
jgi:uncharacterized UBP type Zn finger protein